MIVDAHLLPRWKPSPILLTTDFISTQQKLSSVFTMESDCPERIGQMEHFKSLTIKRRESNRDLETETKTHWDSFGLIFTHLGSFELIQTHLDFSHTNSSATDDREPVTDVLAPPSCKNVHLPSRD